MKQIRLSKKMRILVTKNASFRKRGWVLRLVRGQGAGYVGGWTAYVARGDLHRREETRALGVTRNANLVPITKH